jgi:putative membrane protein
VEHAPFQITSTVVLALTGLCYGWRWTLVRRVSPDLIPLRRVAAFGGGLLVLFMAAASPLAVLGHESLAIHMVVHILLMAVAPPLLLLGAPILLLFRTLPKHILEIVVVPFIESTPARLVGGVLFHPVTCWLAATITVLGWHDPAAFELAIHSPVWHEIQLLSFLVAGLLFWWPVIQPWPSAAPWSRWSIPLYLFFATLPCDALSAFLTFCDRVVYRPFLSMPNPLHLSPLQDQEWAGVLMWVSITLIYMTSAIVITLRILTPVGQPGETSELRRLPATFTGV